MREAPIFAVARHRIGIDGDGVVSLVCFSSCSLGCKYCINPECFDRKYGRIYTTRSLYETLLKDQLYFLATGGGVCFGGGEPLLRSKFIAEFRGLCGRGWKINMETSLNVSADRVERLIGVVDRWFIDIKDLNADIYKSYTGQSLKPMMNNLQILAKSGVQDQCTIRIPLIPRFNTEADRKRSQETLRLMGFTDFDLFEYRTTPNDIALKQL